MTIKIPDPSNNKPKRDIDYHFRLTTDEYEMLKHQATDGGFNNVAAYLLWLIRQQSKLSTAKSSTEKLK